MRKKFIDLLFLSLVLTTAAACAAQTDIPASAERTIQEDYAEWVHPPRLAGPCEPASVVKVEWITPRGVTGQRPVVWLKINGKFAAILGLSAAQAEWIGGTVSAQPLMRLPDVSIYRLCRFSNVTSW